MTPSPPDEAIHFRGKTLTPESPRPLHIPEPSNIPVLENQMDPVFNDTSTYENLTSKQEEEGLPHRAAQDNGPYQSANNIHSRNGDGDTTVREQEPAHVPSAIEYQQKPPESTAAHLNAASKPPMEALANGVPQSPLSQQRPSDTGMHVASDNVTTETGIDFQSLLDNITASASTAPSGPAFTATTSSPPNNSIIQEGQQPTTSPLIPASADLPPRPPPQDLTAFNAGYSPTADFNDYHQPLNQNASQAVAPYTTNPQGGHLNSSAAAPGVPPGSSSGVNGLPPPPVATFQQQNPTVPPEATSHSGHKSRRADRHGERSGNYTDDEAPWPPDIQRKYDEFLRDERVYVTEGLWDRFPPGSRLFVGNLPTERVTKRDLFHLFHKYGKLAQISIKQAYGFIQFLDSSSCHQALQIEQGGLVRGRSIHLEISKPQKNTRAGPSQPDSARVPASRRSRSPEFSRAGNANSRAARNQGGDRHERNYDGKRVPFSDFRDDHGSSRRRDDYRPPPRSPSPRPFRGREGGYRSRDRTPDRFDRRDRRRSRSPYGRERRFRSPSPRNRPGYDENDPAYLRRAPRDLPDLQIMAFDDVDKKFVYHVESSFSSRGFRVDVLVEPPAYMDGAIQRQVNEGIPFIVKLSRGQQYSGKVTLLMLNFNSGASKPRPNEYSDLDLHVAVEMAVQAQSRRRAAAAAPNLYQPNVPFSAPSMMPRFPQALPQAQAVNPPLSNPNQIANLISSLDGPSLQSLLGVLQQTQPGPQPTQQSIPITPNTVNPVDLASLLNSATQQNTIPTMPNPGLQQPQPTSRFGVPVPPQPLNRPDPNLLALLAKGLGSGNPSQSQTSAGSQVQNIVNQLSKWKQ
ncbi:putative RNA-binding protein C3H8,09c [Talaromyces islandicus]|uniref:Putative RNA-binding protein C3H8,09c n=1 Tax=Talaromyces islandicus TaxID=28573 RepID=A0A0U1LQF5_TALIS|nr:putative RNA-binding protein C3H8,09c [Talaromyces islandicus]